MFKAVLSACIAVFFLSSCSSTSQQSTAAQVEPISPIVDKTVVEIAEDKLTATPIKNIDKSEAEKQQAPTTSSTSPFWLDLQKGFSLEKNAQHPDVKRYLAWYQKNPSHLRTLAERAKPFAYLIHQKLRANKMPSELLLLPAVESTFDTLAYSPVHAAGLWQFMPATADAFGIQRDKWFDGRRDPIQSTDAAIRYLKQLHSMFDGDWLLALAAYNSGQGTVKRAMLQAKKKGQKADFWHIRLPKETKDYVPKLVALALIIEQPSRYGVTLPPWQNGTYLQTVDAGSQIDLSLVATHVGMSLDDVRMYNGGYRHIVTPPHGPHSLLLPHYAATKIKSLLANTSPETWVPVKEHIVVKGDTLSGIAYKYDVTSSWIKDNNNLTSTKLQIGQKLRIPTASFLAVAAKERPPEPVYHTVAAGDTLWSISRKFGASVFQIKQWNNLQSDTLKPNQTLLVSEYSEPVVPASQRKLYYKVKNGDSLWKIANRFKVSVNDLTKWNNLSKKSYLKLGQSLTLFIDPHNI